jgi:DNA-binding response OmpR family regulator
MSMRILLLEDDLETARTLCAGLGRNGFDVVHAASCGEALRHVGVSRFDAAVLDRMVPGGSGYDVLRRLRESGSGIPVLILTARDRVADRVDGLERGADDYLVKPFAFAELLARLRTILRRPSRGSEPLRIGALEIDFMRRLVTAGDRRLDLTRIEFDLLLALAEQRGAAVTRRDLLRIVWGYDFEPGTNVVEVHVARLRRKLEAFAGTDVIRTVRGVGYALGG